METGFSDVSTHRPRWLRVRATPLVIWSRESGNVAGFMGRVRQFLDHHFRHFNAREVVAASRAYRDHVEAGGRMLLAMAGAMSTAELGVILARMIREDKVHAISCTGANLEEDVFNLIAHDGYEVIPDWRALSAEDEQALLKRGMNRVTDTCIPENAMRELERRLVERWQRACDQGARRTPYQFLAEVLSSGELEPFYQIDPAHSWILAAIEKRIPVYSPGWEDSSTGNFLAAAVRRGRVAHHQCVWTGTEQFDHLMSWYEEGSGRGDSHPSVGFFQIGGGIAGDFAICAVPCLLQDLKLEVPLWGYFAQISDAVTSYGGYSGAVPNEKITWAKLDAKTPKFMIQSDASVVVPLIFAYVLDD